MRNTMIPQKPNINTIMKKKIEELTITQQFICSGSSIIEK